MRPSSPAEAADRGIVGLLLCAGQSRRFGADKLLHRLPDGRPIALAAAQPLLGACDAVAAVLRPEQGELADLLAARGVLIVPAPEAERGMGHSLAAGVRAHPHATGWLVALGDMPGVAPETVASLVATLRAGAAIVVPEHDGRRGHPVGFAATYFAALSGLRGDVGARGLLQADPSMVRTLVVTDPGIHRDIDRPADLETT